MTSEMMGLVLLLLFLVQSHLALVTAQTKAELYVDASSMSTDSLCGNISSPCPTLEAAVRNVIEDLDSVAICILSHNLTLSHPVVLQNLTAVELRSHNPNGTVVTCAETNEAPPGLVFEAVADVTVSDIWFTGCGALWNYTSPNFTYMYEYRAVVHLHWCSNATIANMNASGNHGAGVAIVDSRSGIFNISNSHFSYNNVPVQDLSKYRGGGGIYIREQAQAFQSHLLQFLVSDCTFEHNRASFPGNYSFLNVFNQPHRGTGRGGGLDAIFWYNTSWNTITVTDCFFRNNTAYLGGGLAIQIQYESHHNHIHVERCVFEHNGCMEGLRTGSGGGAHFGYSFYGSNETQPRNNHYLIRDCIFRDNCAELGGGMTFFSSRSSFEEATRSNTFMLDNCSWVGNSAHIGAAVDISPHVLGRTQEGFLPTLVFKNCYFLNNRVAFRNLELYQSFGSGALFSSLFNVDFVGNVHFENNTGSAFVIVNAVANFSMSNATFVRNTGVQGGAISLTGVAAMHIGPGNTYTFIENRATDRGGAIYVYLIDDHDFAASRSCFLFYSEYDVPGSEWDASFYFLNNRAGTYGHSIFSSTVLSCILLVQTEENLFGNYHWNTTMVFRWPGVFHYDNRTENQIATEGGTFNITDTLPFKVIPGEEHKLAVKIFDDVGQEIETMFRASMVNKSVSGVSVDDAFSCLSGNIIELRGETGNTGALLLETVSSRKNSITMNITLLPCPPGFKLLGNECICNTNTYSAIVSCDLNDFHANLKLGYWAGYMDDNMFVTGLCPLAFCSYNNSHNEREVPLPRVTSPSHLDEYICGPTRAGVLCGRCNAGYSVYYHSPSYNCGESHLCKWGWLFYILSELVPVTLMFIAILALNISFTSGNVNGFILFSQLLDPVVVNGSGVLQYPTVISILSWGYQLIYGVFTIEFFNIEPLSFCLWKGATVLDVLVFRYVTFVYAFLLVILTLLFLKYHGQKFVSKYLRITTIKNSVIHGLSAFIILCYAQCTKVSINILITGTVQGENGAHLRTRRVLFNGDIPAFSVEHLPYALPAVACLLTISTIPPALLLLYPSINKIMAFCKISDSKVVVAASKLVPINKLKPFLDSFQGCFRDELRFFAGIYFLYRWIALLLYAAIPSVTGFYTSLGAAYILILMLHTVFQPYESRTNNIVDGFLLANLALIYSIAGYNYLFSQGLIDTYDVQNTYIATTASIQLILIYLPIVGMAIYIAIVLCRKARPKRERTFSDYTVVEALRPSVTSTVIDGVFDGPEEFPARMLEMDYEQFEERQPSSPPTTCVSNPSVNDDEVFVDSHI